MTGPLFAPEEKKTKVVGIALTPSISERLARAAEANKITISQAGRKIIEKFFADLDATDDSKKEKSHAGSPVFRAHPRR